jgi:hypothetical protein
LGWKELTLTVYKWHELFNNWEEAGWDLDQNCIMPVLWLESGLIIPSDDAFVTQNGLSGTNESIFVNYTQGYFFTPDARIRTYFSLIEKPIGLNENEGLLFQE